MKLSKRGVRNLIEFFFLFQQMWSPFIVFGIINSVFVLISKLIACTVILECLALSVKNPKILRLPILISLVYVSLFISTVHGGGDIRRWFSMVYCPVGIASLFAINFSNLRKAKQFVQYLSTLMYITCAIEFIFILLFPLGINKMYFLGGENYVGFPLMVGLILVISDKFLNNASINKTYTYIVMQCITMFIIFSGGNLVGTIIGIILMTPYFKRLVSVSLNKIILIIFSLFIFLIVLDGLQLIITHPLTRYIVEDCLGKDLSFTHRTVIWAQVIYGFLKQPLLGHGIRESVNLFTIPVGDVLLTFSAHNQLLQSLYEGGIMIYVMLIPIFLNVSKYLKYTLFRRFFNASIIGLMTMYMTEASGLSFLLMFLIIGYSVGLITKENVVQLRKKEKNESIQRKRRTCHTGLLSKPLRYRNAYER